MADNMQLLGSRGGAGEPRMEREPAEATSGASAGAPAAGAKPAAPGKKPPLSDMEDDIPF